MGGSHDHAPHARRSVPVVQCLAAAALFGAATPASKALLGEARPLGLAGLLYLGAALAMLPLAPRGGSPELRWQRRSLGRLALAVVLGGGIAPALLLLGLAAAPASDVSLWLNLETVATAALAWAFFREPMTRKCWAAVGLLTLAGGLLAAPSGFAAAPAAGLVALACLAWGLENNLVSVIDGFTPAQVTFAKGLFAGGVNLALGLVLEGAPSARVVLAGLGIGTLGYGVSILLHIAGSQHLGATRAQAVFSTAPFLGLALAWLVLGEPLGMLELAAAGIMAAGVGLMLVGKHQHEHAHEAVSHVHEHGHDDGHHEHEHEHEHGHEHGREGAGGARHVHVHAHVAGTHSHPHDPDLHHRHAHS